MHARMIAPQGGGQHMRTTIFATLLALGMLALVAPTATAAEISDIESRPICETVAIYDWSYSVSTSVGTVSVVTRYTHIATVCVGP